MYETQIAAGIKYLEQEEGITDWRKRLAGLTLIMVNGYNCVIGHLFGEYYDYVNDRDLSFEWAIEHGFNLPDDVPYSDYIQLGEEWKAAIAGTDPTPADTTPVGV